MSNLHSYLIQARDAIQTGNGATLARLLQSDGDAWMIVMSGKTSEAMLEAQLMSKLQQVSNANEWKGIFKSFLTYLTHVKDGAWDKAYMELTSNSGATKNLDRILKDSDAERSHLSPVVIGMCRLVKSSAERAADMSRRHSLKADQLEDCGRHIMAFLNAMAPQNMPRELVRGCAMAIGNTLIKIYFKLNTLNNCKTVNNVIARTKCEMTDFPKAHVVTYRYYMGRQAIFDEKWQEADQELSDAFRYCLPSAKSNLRKILQLLIPVRMLMGKLPTRQLLQQYGMEDLGDVAAAVRQGDVGLMQRTLHSNMYRFIQTGTFFLYERLVQSVYRRLVKKLHVVNREVNGEASAHQLPLTALLDTLTEQGVEMDMIHLECILANLISRKFIKGYLHHQRKILVAHRSVEAAYPPIGQCVLGDPGGFTM